MKSVSDVIDTFEGIMELPSKSMNESLISREVAALGAELLEEAVLFMLTIRTETGASEESFVRLVTRHLESYGITPTTLETLRSILRASRQWQYWDESR